MEVKGPFGDDARAVHGVCVRSERVGIRPDGRAPAREGTEVLLPSGERIGVVTSGGFGPSVNGPVAMGYVEAGHAEVGTAVNLMVRGRR